MRRTVSDLPIYPTTTLPLPCYCTLCAVERIHRNPPGSSTPTQIYSNTPLIKNIQRKLGWGNVGIFRVPLLPPRLGNDLISHTYPPLVWLCALVTWLAGYRVAQHKASSGTLIATNRIYHITNKLPIVLHPCSHLTYMVIEGLCGEQLQTDAPSRTVRRCAAEPPVLFWCQYCIRTRTHAERRIAMISI